MFRHERKVFDPLNRLHCSVAAAVMAGSAVIGASASQNAANKQATAAGNALSLQQQMFNTVQGETAPIRGASNSALTQLQALLGISSAPTAPDRESFTTHSGPQGSGGPLSKLDPGANALVKAGVLPDGGHMFSSGGQPGQKDSFDQSGYDTAMQNYQTQLDQYNQTINDPSYGSLMHQFSASDLNANLAPNWQFVMQQGQGANQNMNNQSGGLLSGNTMKGLQDYTQNLAGNQYQQAYQNYNTNQTNIYNRLANIAGLGQVNNQTAATNATATGLNAGNSAQAIGQAQASGIVGSANAITGGLSQAGSWYGAQNLLNTPQTSSNYASGGPMDTMPFTT